MRLLIELLEYSDQGVSDLAQQALVKLGASVIDELSAMLPSLPVASKARAARILTELGDRRVVDLVCDEFSASPWSATGAGIAALAAFRGERALRTLLDVAVHGRNRALRALQSWHGPHARRLSTGLEPWTGSGNMAREFRRST